MGEWTPARSRGAAALDSRRFSFMQHGRHVGATSVEGQTSSTALAAAGAGEMGGRRAAARMELHTAQTAAALVNDAQ